MYSDEGADGLVIRFFDGVGFLGCARKVEQVLGVGSFWGASGRTWLL